MTIEELVRKYNLRDGHRFMIEELLKTGHTLEELDRGLAEAMSDESDPPAIFCDGRAVARSRQKQGEAKR